MTIRAFLLVGALTLLDAFPLAAAPENNGAPAPAAGGAELGAFLRSTPGEVRTLQVKLTYIDDQNKSVPTVAFTSFTNVLDLDRFVRFRRSGVHYGNDDLSTVLNFTVSPEELGRVIAAAGEIPAVATGKDSGAFLSFSLYNFAPGRSEQFLEVLLGYDDAKALHARIRSAIDPSNGIALDVLAQQADILF